ncbi:MAG TPA: ABC transporter substrate-binding protein [Clostridia bacterium]|nr:ABC transporter substrate-binding protein [Clostridia bacterium]
MKDRRTVGILGMLLVVAMVMAGVVGCGGGEGADSEQVTIGITQIVEHPALDAARQGFIDAMTEGGYVEGENVIYDFNNAQNDKSNALTIAQKFANDKVDLIFAIATPTAQAASQATADIPILITAVTDPVAAGLVESMEAPGTNVTGTTDMNPIAEQLELIKAFVPGAKKVGVIYNAGEVNSEVQVKIAKEVAGDIGLEIVEASVATSADVNQAAGSLAGRVDAIYVPTDNTVVSALETVLQVAEEHKIPVIAGEGDSVERGALATVGIDYYELGRQTAEMAIRVLKGEDPATMPIEKQKNMQLYVNKSAAKAMGVEIPEDILNEADQVFE